MGITTSDDLIISFYNKAIEYLIHVISAQVVVAEPRLHRRWEHFAVPKLSPSVVFAAGLSL